MATALIQMLSDVDFTLKFTSYSETVQYTVLLAINEDYMQASFLN